MRLWHKDLISVLPRQHLLAQWRECCCIIRNIAVNGTPNHLLVNKVLDYPPLHFMLYTNLVLDEMTKRDYEISETSYVKMVSNFNKAKDYFNMTNYLYTPTSIEDIYRDWHNDRYLIQCYYNLEEKYDCGGISRDEWNIINNFMEDRL